jgi:DNA-binding transcriptional MerR regulator
LLARFCFSSFFALSRTLIEARQGTSKPFVEQGGLMPTDEKFTIGQLANASEVPSTTIRYYERIGLIEPECRSHSNYRLYSEKSLERLRFIRAAQATGFILEDIRTLMGDGSSTPCCGDVKLLIEERLQDVNQRLRDLKHVQKVLKTAHQKCAQGNPRRKCKVIESLRGG